MNNLELVKEWLGNFGSLNQPLREDPSMTMDRVVGLVRALVHDYEDLNWEMKCLEDHKHDNDNLIVSLQRDVEELRDELSNLKEKHEKLSSIIND